MMMRCSVKASSISDCHGVSLLFSHFQRRPGDCGTESVSDCHSAFNRFTLTWVDLIVDLLAIMTLSWQRRQPLLSLDASEVSKS